MGCVFKHDQVFTQSSPQRPRSFCSAPRIPTSGSTQHRKYAILGPSNLTNLIAWEWETNTLCTFRKSGPTGGCNSWCWPKESRRKRAIEVVFLIRIPFVCSDTNAPQNGTVHRRVQVKFFGPNNQFYVQYSSVNLQNLGIRNSAYPN